MSVWLGPRFNRDSCRACHFQGAVGGAGPSDVPVLRQGCLDADGAFMMPQAGPSCRSTPSTACGRSPDADAAFFERRETPALFGLGPLYSALLLHDVAGPEYIGIGDGSAPPRMLRTPPLWGLRLSPPYLHDGSASSVESAIAAHASEAEVARNRYEALAADARPELLAFLAAL